MAKPSLSHFDPQSGKAKMVDVGAKPLQLRQAKASGRIEISPTLSEILLAGKLEKGDAITIAKTAGILAAKQTSQLIPMCHPLPLSQIEVVIEVDHTQHRVQLEATAKTTAQTGVEMEALTAISVAALTFYDMCKAVDKRMCITTIRLEEKKGGKSGHFLREGS